MENKIYWYELVYRGISVGTQPKKGFVTNDLEYVNSKGWDYGAVAYCRPLTAKEIDDYELKAIESPRDLNKQEKEMLDLLA